MAVNGSRCSKANRRSSNGAGGVERPDAVFYFQPSGGSRDVQLPQDLVVFGPATEHHPKLSQPVI